MGPEVFLGSGDEEIEDVPHLCRKPVGGIEIITPVQAEEIVGGEVEIVGKGAQFFIVWQRLAGFQKEHPLRADADGLGQIGGAEKIPRFQIPQAFGKAGRHIRFPLFIG